MQTFFVFQERSDRRTRNVFPDSAKLGLRDVSYGLLASGFFNGLPHFMA